MSESAPGNWTCWSSSRSEIAEVAPLPGEEEPLQAELNRLANLETIAQSAAGALTLLSDGEENALGFLGEAVRALNASARYDDASAALQQELREALDSLQAVSGELRAVAEDGAADPEKLARVEGRLGALGKLRTKYGPTLDDVLTFQAGVEEELAALTRTSRMLEPWTPMWRPCWRCCAARGPRWTAPVSSVPRRWPPSWWL